MSSRPMKETVSFKIGYKLGEFTMNMIIKSIKLIWTGTVTMSLKRKEVFALYLFMGVLMLVSLNLYGDCIVVVLITVLISIISGLFVYREQYPTKLKIQMFETMFNEIGFKSVDGNIPTYLYDKEISDYLTLIAFNTLIPLSEWKSKKDLLEMYLANRIIDIKQDTIDNRQIHIIVEMKQLPELITFDYSYLSKEGNILNFGIDYYGLVGLDLDKYPHTFVAGSTNTGKSNILKCLIYGALLKGYDVTLIDFKRGVSFSEFSDYITIRYTYDTVIKALDNAVDETNKRLDILRDNRVDNINRYNSLGKKEMKRKIIFIDELAELLKTKDSKISDTLYTSLETLSRISRAVGVHLIMGVQRPDSTIVTGQIKNNVTYRICGHFPDKEPSRIVLSSDIANKLPDIKGRFIVKDNDMREVQTFYFDEVNYSVLETISSKKVSDTSTDTKNIPINVHIRAVEEEKEENNSFTSDEITFDFKGIKK